MVDILQTTFSKHFVAYQLFCLDYNSIKICSYVSNRQHVVVGLDNGLAPVHGR